MYPMHTINFVPVDALLHGLDMGLSEITFSLY